MDAKIVQHYNKDKTTAHYPVTIPDAVVFDDGSTLKTKSAGYAPSSHVHDSDYYKKSEIDTKFRQLDSGDAIETTTLNASELTLTSGSGVVGSTGEFRSGGLGSTWKSTNKISVDGYDFIEFLAVVRNTSANMTLGYAFYDYNQSYLEGDRYSYNSELESSQSKVLTLAVPANAKYFACTITQWNTDGFYIKLTKNASTSSLVGDITTLETTDKTSAVAAINELKNQPYNDKLFGKGTGVGSIQQIGEGSTAEANGDWSFAEGDFTSAENRAEHAQGSFNVSHKASDTKGDAGNTLHSVGCAWEEADRKNAEEIMQNGDFYILGVGGYDGTNPNTTGVKTVQSILNEFEFATNEELLAIIV